MNLGYPTAPLSYTPTIIPSKDPMHDQNVLQIKYLENFLSENPNSAPISDFSRVPFMLSTVKPIMVHSHLT